MKNIDKLHRIKDFFNRIISEVYYTSDKGLITHLIEEDSDDSRMWYDVQFEEVKEMFVIPGDSKVESSVVNNSIAIIYNRQTFHISPHYKLGMSEVKSLYKVFSVGYTDVLNGLNISTVYDIVRSLRKYSTEELRLYLKMKS